MKSGVFAKLRDFTWAAAFMVFLAAGIFAFFYPSKTVAANLGNFGLVVWAAFFAGGGLISFVGTVARQWWGELVGLPLLVSGAATYSAAVLAQYFDPIRGENAYLFVSTVLFGFALVLLRRWFGVLVRVQSVYAGQDTIDTHATQDLSRKQLDQVIARHRKDKR